MYTNLAYLGEEHEDIVDLSKPLLLLLPQDITGCIRAVL